MNDGLRIDRARLRAVCALRSIGARDLAAACGVSPRHLDLVVTGARPLCDRLRGALVEAIGSDGWRFTTGEINTLDATPPRSRACAVQG